MSISAKLETIHSAIGGVCSGIRNNGGTVPSIQSLYSLQSAVDSIAKGIIEKTLSYISNSAVTIIPYSTFYNFSNLTYASFYKCSVVQDNAFAQCYSLSQVYLPYCSVVKSYAFFYCRSLQSVSLPECREISEGGFQCCFSLPSITLRKCGYIGSYAFDRCVSLESIYIGSSRCTLYNSNAFNDTPITSSTGSIFVYNAYLSYYKTATNWAYFSNRIFGY